MVNDRGIYKLEDAVEWWESTMASKRIRKAKLEVRMSYMNPSYKLVTLDLDYMVQAQTGIKEALHFSVPVHWHSKTFYGRVQSRIGSRLTVPLFTDGEVGGYTEEYACTSSRRLDTSLQHNNSVRRETARPTTVPLPGFKAIRRARTIRRIQLPVLWIQKREMVQHLGPVSGYMPVLGVVLSPCVLVVPISAVK
ncbi:hypothetical protein BDN70DRAFT_897369 [Pholiota conissans]|uniref:Uncharacterized protein n=1 Tax=Pholiota conissans TaxID=109636 RepID=A0A9P5YXA3_9AGAR|nr:hypothetical protein BDN70DRAFT_897369 [Pholiota conissans]